MARHNRDARGTDQRGRQYEISYPPDWLHQIKVSRTLPNGRRSTKTLFRNPASQREQAPGARVRARVGCAAEALDFGIEVDDPEGIVTRVVVQTRARHRRRGGDSGDDTIEFVFDDQMPPPPPQ